MKWRNSKERELLAAGGSRDITLPNKNNPHQNFSNSHELSEMSLYHHCSGVVKEKDIEQDNPAREAIQHFETEHTLISDIAEQLDDVDDQSFLSDTTSSVELEHDMIQVS